jgi:hypothetical protein
MVEIRNNDPERAELIKVIQQWKLNLTEGHGYTVPAVISRALVKH